MSETRMILSEKGKSLLVLDGYKFRGKKILKSGETFWTCTVSKCNAKVFTLGPGNTISRKETEHNHGNDMKKLNRQILNVESKQKAIEDITERPSKIIDTVMDENIDTMNSLTRKDIAYVRNNMYYKRRQLRPLLQNGISDDFETSQTLNLKTIKNESELVKEYQHEDSSLRPEQVGGCFASDLAEYQHSLRYKAETYLADYLENCIEEKSSLSPAPLVQAFVTTEDSTNASELFHSRFKSNILFDE